MRVRLVVGLVLAGLGGVVTLADRPSAAPAAPAVGPTFESIGPLAFGPDNVLFAADTQARRHRGARPGRRIGCAWRQGRRRSRPEDRGAAGHRRRIGRGDRHGRAAEDPQRVLLGDARPGRRRQGRRSCGSTAAARSRWWGSRRSASRGPRCPTRRWPRRPNAATRGRSRSPTWSSTTGSCSWRASPTRSSRRSCAR